MEDKPETPPETEPKSDDTPQPAPAPATVMDVVPPPPPAPPVNQAPSPSADSAPSDDDSKPHEPPAVDSDHDDSKTAEDKPKTKLDEAALASVTPSKPQAPKKPSSGVGLAVFGTVVIVLGLAGLAVYAYLKTR